MADRPKLEIVRTEDAVEVWLAGRIVSQHIGHLAKLEAVEETAKDIAAALGADVERADEPSPQPYTYFIAYRYGGGVGSIWHTRVTPIEDAASEAETRAYIDAKHPQFGGVVITNFILTDGPY